MVRKYKLAKMEVLAFRNGIRLHQDAISLFRLRSYPTAYFLSILSLEEFGKADALSHFLFYWSESPLTEKELQDWFLELYKHPFKQKAFYRGRLTMSSLKRLESEWKKIGMIEMLKQNSAYVGLPKNNRLVNLKGKINNPFKVKKEKAEKQITVINDYLIELTLGQIHKHLGIDNEGVQKLLNRKFLSKLYGRWESKGQEIKRQIIRIEKWAAGGYKTPKLGKSDG